MEVIVTLSLKALVLMLGMVGFILLKVILAVHLLPLAPV